MILPFAKYACLRLNLPILSQHTIISVVGARPQFIKSAPFELAFSGISSCRLLSVHTGQHYDENMSRVFFDQLGLMPPAYNLQAGSGTHGRQTAKMMEGMEEVFEKEKPSMLVVYGDTNSTLAAALVAAKMLIPVAHVEAGLRSYNRSMPEEVNRVLTDHVSNLLFIPSEVSRENLKKEGITEGVINTGDIMLDILRMAQEKGVVRQQAEGEYYYATIHRSYNTDDPQRMRDILETMNGLEHPVYFAIHPRTSALLDKHGISTGHLRNIRFIPPQGYFDNLGYMLHSRRVITDSGGLQKEAWFLRKPCVTLRPETEWVETLENGWNTLVFDRLNELKPALESTPGEYRDNIYGDGHAAEKMRDAILQFLSGK